MVNLPLLDISRKYGSRGSDMIDISGFVWGEVDFRALLPLECPWTISSGTQAAQERQLPVRGGEREKYGDNKGNSSEEEYKKIFTGSGGQGIDKRNTRGRHVGALRCQPAALVLCGSDL